MPIVMVVRYVISNYLADKLLRHSLGIESFTMPETVYLGLADENATPEELVESDFTHEITGYEEANRPAIPFGAPEKKDAEDALSDTISKNAGPDPVEFTDMPACTVAYFLVCDSATKGAGHLLYGVRLEYLTGENAGKSDPKVIEAGQSFRAPVGNIVVFMGNRRVAEETE